MTPWRPAPRSFEVHPTVLTQMLCCFLVSLRRWSLTKLAVEDAARPRAASKLQFNAAGPDSSLHPGRVGLSARTIVLALCGYVADGNSADMLPPLPERPYKAWLAAEEAGGRARVLDDTDADGITHVFATTRRSESYSWALARQLPAVSFFWLWECCRFSTVLEATDEVDAADLRRIQCRIPGLDWLCVCTWGLLLVAAENF